MANYSSAIIYTISQSLVLIVILILCIRLIVKTLKPESPLKGVADSELTDTKSATVEAMNRAKTGSK